LRFTTSQTFHTGEETFAILETNAIELLFKAQLLKICYYKMKHFYVIEPITQKKDYPTKQEKPQIVGYSKSQFACLGQK